jgi:hypothetical protein
MRYLPDHPDNSYAWHMAAADDATISRVAALAAAVFPLDDIVTGPAGPRARARIPGTTAFWRLRSDDAAYGTNLDQE